MAVIETPQWASPDPSGGHEMPSPFPGARLKALRTGRGWSQANLANVIDALITKNTLLLITAGAS